MTSAGIGHLVSLFETFARTDVERLGLYYCDDAYFKDPFNEVRGVEAIQRVFGRMFETLDDPRFVITQQLAQGNDCWLVWEFQFRFRTVQRRRTQVVRGASHLLLAADGRIQSHRDYWDAAEELYEKLPVIGIVMRWLKKRVSHQPG